MTQFRIWIVQSPLIRWSEDQRSGQHVDQSINSFLGDGTIQNLNCATTSHQRIRGSEDNMIIASEDLWVMAQFKTGIVSSPLSRGSEDHKIRASDDIWVMASHLIRGSQNRKIRASEDCWVMAQFKTWIVPSPLIRGSDQRTTRSEHQSGHSFRFWEYWQWYWYWYWYWSASHPSSSLSSFHHQTLLGPEHVSSW